MSKSLLQRAAGALANSVLLRRGKALFADNATNWELPLSKSDKLWTGSWLILDDYSRGIFPPTFLDQQTAYQAEKNYRFSIPGMSVEQMVHGNMTKPFWFGKGGRGYLNQFNHLTLRLEQIGITPPANILELGCGSGWTAEFLATMGYAVCGTTISEDDIVDANRRTRSLEIKGLTPKLKFVAAPMESVQSTVAGEAFDAAFVYEALHHAFDWRKSVRSVYDCLRSGGWFLICNEPNILHTCVSYRVAKLSNTHEIGFSKGELIAELRKTGFRKVISVGPSMHCWFRPHWLLAQKQ